MALPDRTGNPLCHFLSSGANFWLVPLNSEGNDALDSWFDTNGTNTTVAFTQEAAGKGGYSQTTGEYQAMKAATS